MNRIIVVGTTGSGKSTLAKKISRELNYKYIQLDALFWKPNWTQPSNEEFLEKLQIEISSDCWIIDGNYGQTHPLTWAKADCVIWIDLPLWKTLYHNIIRSVKRSIRREELWQGTGNRESFKRMFSKDSIILWLLKTYKSNIKLYESRMKDAAYSHIKFVRLKSRKEIKNWVAASVRQRRNGDEE